MGKKGIQVSVKNLFFASENPSFGFYFYISHKFWLAFDLWHGWCQSQIIEREKESWGWKFNAPTRRDRDRNTGNQIHICIYLIYIIRSNMLAVWKYV